jgi:phosphate uptake regulator
MNRKLVKQAGRAVTITLPIEWVRKNGLKPGDEIDIETIEKDLILKSGKKIIGGSIQLDTTDFPRRMKHYYINAAYAKGIDEIKLESDKDFYHDLNQNIGFAIVQQKGNKFVIRDISGISSENLDNIFKRVFQMILNFYDQAIDDIFGENKESYETVKKIDGEVNKFVLFLQRSIMKLSYPDPAIGRIMFAYSFALEKIGDEILRIWRTNIENKVKKDKKIKEIILLSKKGLEKAFEIYYQSSPEKVKEIMTIKDLIRKKSIKLLNINPVTAKFLMHSVKIVEDSSDLTHLALMKKFKPS